MVNVKKMNFEDKFVRSYCCSNLKRRYAKRIKKINNKRVRQELKKEITYEL